MSSPTPREALGSERSPGLRHSTGGDNDLKLSTALMLSAGETSELKPAEELVRLCLILGYQEDLSAAKEEREEREKWK